MYRSGCCGRVDFIESVHAEKSCQVGGASNLMLLGATLPSPLCQGKRDQTRPTSYPSVGSMKGLARVLS